MKKSPLRCATPLRRTKKRLKIRIRKKDLEWARAVKERDRWECRRSVSIVSGWWDHHRASATSRRGLHACHIFGRSKRSTRWDLDNGLTLCMGCHLYFHAHPLEFVEFAKRELGEAKFGLLRRRAMNIVLPEEEPNDDGSPEERTPSIHAQRRDALRR